jgi:1-deoxy-D-xylulose-5-phosphate synthase
MVKIKDYKYLDRVDSPSDLKRLSLTELPLYCSELRDFIVEQLSHTPGHLAASLGALELNVALHYVFDTPHDKIVWDVGHQAYAHKIITGRRSAFHTLRKLGGIAGFPRPEESPYDAFIGGHSSVSISAALGMATANRLMGGHEHVVAVIGDGAMTGGLAFEGLNNAGADKSDLLVVLNDNRIAIDMSRSAMSEYLLGITTSRRYNRFKTKLWNRFSPGSKVHNMLKKTSNAIKHGLLQQSNLFESFGFRYFGPVDGHDVVSLVKVLRDLKEIPGPKLLHTLTVKGKGYEPAEKDKVLWHAPGRFDAATGQRICSEGGAAKYQDVFGVTLLELARRDKRIVGITPAMPTGSSLNIMMRELPERTFDVGIAEGHAVTFAAGMAAEGMVPFCTIYSSFAQRAYDNIIHDVAIENLGVVLCLDRSGVVGEDGTTHQGVFDLPSLGAIPNLTIASPLDERELRDMMYTASKSGRPFVIRYPRGCGEGVEWQGTEFGLLPIGRGRKLREGRDVAVVTFGIVGNSAARACEEAEKRGVSAALYDLRFAKPLDAEMLAEIGARFKRVITVEDGAVWGGVGSWVEDFFSREGYHDTVVRKLGVGDKFVEHGTVAELWHLNGYDTEGILAAILQVTDNL